MRKVAAWMFDVIGWVAIAIAVGGLARLAIPVLAPAFEHTMDTIYVPRPPLDCVFGDSLVYQAGIKLGCRCAPEPR